MSDCPYLVQKTKVLVKKLVSDETVLGITMPDNVKKPPCIANVIEIGEHVTFVKPGDKIVYNRYSGMYLEVSENLEEPDLLVLDEEEILAKFKR